MPDLDIYDSVLYSIQALKKGHFTEVSFTKRRDMPFASSSLPILNTDRRQKPFRCDIPV